MPEYLVIDRRNFKQEFQAEERDAQGQLLKPTRSALNENLVSLRVDKQFLLKARTKANLSTQGQRQAIINTAEGVSLGKEVAQGVQVIEYERMFRPAVDAVVEETELDEAGNIVKLGKILTNATEERESHIFTLRLNGLHIAKTELTDAEFESVDWRRTLTTRVANSVEAAL